MSRVLIGIPCYDKVSSETLEDYSRLMYHLGRRTKHDFFLAIKSKSEQFRARNAIVETAFQCNADYLFFLDDDHVINWQESQDASARPSDKYSIVEKLIQHLEDDPKRGIVGALYYKRDGDCGAVLMKEGNEGGYFFMRDDEIRNELQEVAVQGGGCMMIRMELFTKIPYPWFEPEQKQEGSLGTDIQISKKAKEHGYSVWCDTSISIGHVMNKREIVHAKNRHRISIDAFSKEGPQKDLHIYNSAFNLYRMDVEDYLDMDWQDIVTLANKYDAMNMARFKSYENPDDYYRSLGKEQICRQVVFHGLPTMIEQNEMFLSLIDTSRSASGLDFGCGSAPLGFELMLRGHKMDFVDLEGTPAYEFTKWRTNKRGMKHRAGFKMEGPYNYAIFMDSIEHLKDWKSVLSDVCDLLVENGAIITNFFLNFDFKNPEHISLDHRAVKDFLVSKGVYPINDLIFIKRDMAFMDRKEQVA